MSNNQSIVMVASYGGPYGGNFIPSLLVYDEVAKNLGYRTVYVFPDFVSKYDWVDTINSVADQVYFIPYNQYSLDNVKRIRAICKSENAALIYSRMSGWDITARLAMPQLPLIWHMEMNLDIDSLKYKIKYWIKYRILGAGKTFHIAVSEATTQATNHLGVKNRCTWIPNAINTGRLKIKQPYEFHQPVRLLCFAYQPIVKGLDLVLDACEMLNTDGIKYIVMVSAQVHTHEYLQSRYGHNLPEWLKVLDPTDNIAELYNQADILVSASRSEGFSFCLAEALWSGLPIVCSNIPGNNWIDEFRIVLKHEKESVGSLVEKIKECALLNVTGDAQQYNRALMEQKYSVSSWKKQVETVMKEALSI